MRANLLAHRDFPSGKAIDASPPAAERSNAVTRARRRPFSPIRLGRTIIIGLAALAPATWACPAADATSYHALGPYRFKDFAVVYHQGLFHVYAIHQCASSSTRP